MCRISLVSLYQADAHDYTVRKDVRSFASLLRLALHELAHARDILLKTEWG